MQPVYAGKQTSDARGSGGDARYLCYTYVGSGREHVLTLPVAPLNSDYGMLAVTFHGERLEATYERTGLTQAWWLDDSLYIKIDPDLSASYWDFRGAVEGEQRKPEAVFNCKKRR